MERIEPARRLVRLRARKYSRKWRSRWVKLNETDFRVSVSSLLLSANFERIQTIFEPPINDTISYSKSRRHLFRASSSDKRWARLQKWRERERQDRDEVSRIEIRIAWQHFFVPIYGDGFQVWRGSRLGCFFHPRHLRSPYLFKVNGTAGLAQVCPKTRGSRSAQIWTSSYSESSQRKSMESSISKFLTFLLSNCLSRLRIDASVLKGLSDVVLRSYQKSLLLLLFLFITGIEPPCFYFFKSCPRESRFVRIVKNVDKNRRVE